MDSETLVEWAIPAFELGFPVVCVFCLFRAPRLRNVGATALGAVSPMLFVYISALLWHYFRISIYSTGMSFYAIWQMSFVTFVAFAVVGVLLGLLPRPNNLLLRYFIGLASAPVTYHAFYLF
jgi:hypothetical protein